MKRLFPLLGILAMSMSCTNLEVDNNAFMESTQQNVSSKYRSLQEAVSIAQDAISRFDKEGMTKVGVRRKIDMGDIKYSVRPSTKSESGDTLMYIVNFEDEKGFAMVARNRQSPDLIAFVENGNYDGKKSDNPGFNIYMDEITTSLASVNDMPELKPIATQYKTVPQEDQVYTREPLITSTWHQKNPYNYYCPVKNNKKTSVGCVATSIALAMSAFSFPAKISLTFSNAPMNSVTLDWNGMIADSNTDHVALLSRQIGKKVSMRYGVDSSGQSSSSLRRYAKSCLRSFGYTCDEYQNYNLSIMRTSLLNDNPVLIRASDTDNNGHAWVVDGYRYIVKEDKIYKQEGTHLVWRECGYEKEYLTYLHMNYGWVSGPIGYYLTEKISEGDSPISYGSPYYNCDVKIFTGMKGLDKDVSIIPNVHPDIN